MHIFKGTKIKGSVAIALAGTISLSFTLAAHSQTNGDKRQNSGAESSSDKTARLIQNAKALESKKKYGRALQVRVSVAEAYKESRQFEKAISQYKEIVSLCDRYKSTKPHIKASAYKNIGDCLIKAGDVQSAESFYQKMVKTQRTHPGKQNIHYIEALNTIANYYQYKLRKPYLGVPYVEVIVNLERKTGVNSTQNVKRLANLYMESRMYDKAAPMWNYLVASEKHSRNEARKNDYLLQYAICQTKLRRLKAAGPIFESLKSGYERGQGGHNLYGEVLPVSFLSAYVEYLKAANLSQYSAYNARLEKINKIKRVHCPACGRG